MPPFGAALGEEERWDLINFIRALAAGERARQMTPVVQPNRPWLVAPDFTIAVGPAPPRSLKELRDRWMVHLVFFTLPDSRPRLIQLAEAYNTLQATGTEIIAVPMDDGAHIIRRLGGRPPLLFPVITDGAAEIAATYALLGPGPGPAGALAARGAARARGVPARPPGLRARALAAGRARPAAGTTLQTLVDQILLLDKETPAGPPPDEHVH